MKTSKYILGIAIVISLLSPISCKNFLEMPAQTGFNKDLVFSSYRDTETFLYSLYQSVPKIMYGWANNIMLFGPSRVSLTDEAISGSYSGFKTNSIYAGAVTSDWFTTINGEDVYATHWKSIRNDFIMLENIDKVPDASAEVKGRIKGECQLLIAVEYFEMWKRYGGIPIIKSSMSPADYEIIKRQPLDAVYKYIIELCDAVIANPNIPIKVTNPLEFGRATKALAYGLKARTMLYAASPLFNAATPYLDFGQNNNLICFTNYDKNRWKLAMDAALQAIQFCESNGYSIVTSYGVNRNYTIACQKRPKDGNTEIIWGTMYNPNTTEGTNAPPYFTWGMRGRYACMGANTPTHNAVEFYSNTDGTKVNWDVKITTPPNQPEAPYKNLDPRFQQSIAYNGAIWYTNPTLILQFYNPGETGVANGLEGMKATPAVGNYGFRKYLVDYEKSTTGHWPMNPIFRLAELYLIYAEASNEFQGPTAQAFDLLDVIRTRSGMPKVDRSLNQTGLRSYIINERAVELYAEDHRYYDLRRWKIPEVTKIYNVNVLKYLNNTYTYEKYVSQTRVWNDYWFMHPFPLTEITKNYGIIQNPGW
ncbi:MAG: RagB/SusD family nutrient uptake outer membrane protein [Prolixibacteraceae bacterium]|jgi:hypothetical protein|nr:RagB/SusD family nutrient uptake outer membrane protein [Prolixibacteraceae bacterium]